MIALIRRIFPLVALSVGLGLPGSAAHAQGVTVHITHPLASASFVPNNTMLLSVSITGTTPVAKVRTTITNHDTPSDEYYSSQSTYFQYWYTNMTVPETGVPGPATTECDLKVEALDTDDTVLGSDVIQINILSIGGS